MSTRNHRVAMEIKSRMNDLTHKPRHITRLPQMRMMARWVMRAARRHNDYQLFLEEQLAQELFNSGFCPIHGKDCPEFNKPKDERTH